MTTDDPWLRSRMVALRAHHDQQTPIYNDLYVSAANEGRVPRNIVGQYIDSGERDGSIDIRTLQRLFRALRMEHESD